MDCEYLVYRAGVSLCTLLLVLDHRLVQFTCLCLSGMLVFYNRSGFSLHVNFCVCVCAFICVCVNICVYISAYVCAQGF